MTIKGGLKRVLQYCAQPVRRYPKLWVFGLSLYQAVGVLLKTAPAPPQPLDTQTSATVKLPQWLIGEMREIHEIEPKIFPNIELLTTIEEYEVPSSELMGTYKELVSLYGNNVSHVFLVPWLNRGGADLVAIHYIEALLQIGNSGRIVVIATHPAESLWVSRLPGEVTFIHFGGLAKISLDQQRRLLAMFLVQMAPPVIHNINSELGYIVYCMHGEALSAQSSLFASSFCFDFSQEGQAIGYSVSYIAECYEKLTAVLTDNASHVKTMKNLFGFADDSFHVHYQPVRQDDGLAGRKIGGAGECCHILWAGRICRQKRPDILLAIARGCRTRPFMFHVYGAADGDISIIEEFATEENIRYHGPFDGLAEIDCRELEIFLHTSQWDGLPNILLEAMSKGLLVVSADAGGICELVEDGVTGFLIHPFDEVELYIRRLEFCYANRDELQKIREKALQRLAGQHSWERFCRLVKNTPNYTKSFAADIS